MKDHTPTLGTDDLDRVGAEEIGTARCARCCWLTKDGERSTDGPKQCALRGSVIPRPESMVCVDHSERRSERPPVPLGPILHLEGATCNPVQLSPDTPECRKAVLHVLEDIAVVAASELSVQQRIAIWQARAWGDRRHLHHLDRIEDEVLHHLPAGDGASQMSQILQRAAGQELSSDARSEQFIESFTIPGRLLILMSLVVGVLAFWGSIALQEELGVVAAGGIVFVFTLPALVAGGLTLRLGITLLRRLGIPFRVESDQA
jgi:hypothetical protein